MTATLTQLYQEALPHQGVGGFLNLVSPNPSSHMGLCSILRAAVTNSYTLSALSSSIS